MILPTLVLTETANKTFNELAMDSVKNCKDKNHFRNYPYNIEYNFNSRGYRDSEWPENFKGAVWCFGDSFTVGIGAPYNHIWPQLLSKQMQRRTINISLNGASNNWIARKVNELSKEIQPQTLIIHWSYTNRRENNSEDLLIKLVNKRWQELYLNIKDSSWPDCDDIRQFDQLPETIQHEITQHHLHGIDQGFVALRHTPLHSQFDEVRLMHFDKSVFDTDEDIKNTIRCIDLVQKSLPNSNVIHSFVPDFDADKQRILDYVKTNNLKFVKPFDRLDVGRDGFHYDIKTAEYHCNEIIKLL